MDLAHRLRRAIDGAIKVIFPPRCVGCDSYLRAGQLACGRCRHTIFAVDSPQCRICGHPRRVAPGTYGGVDEICRRCLDRRPRFDSARSCWEYDGTIAEAIQRAKYRGHLWAARALAVELRPWLHAQLAQIETACGEQPLLTAVPMHPRDLRRRGYNLAYLLLRQAADGRAIAMVTRKTRRTRAQAGLGRSERVANLRGAFACADDRLAGRSVVVFDDVLTTGATADELARTLRRGGARRVDVLSAARAVAG